MLKSTVGQWWRGGVSCRRRRAAGWQNSEVNQSAEILEVRAVPAPASLPTLPPGDYGGVDTNFHGVSLTIYAPDAKKHQYADINFEETGTFTVKITTKKNGEFILKPITKGLGGSIVLKRDGGILDASVDIHGKVGNLNDQFKILRL
ncbi:MAG: hypothetical protein JWM11_5194 [Planctomycetaceae bacterium]|nr:hypothetical protein [Planctomycetaceae bacterium]